MTSGAAPLTAAGATDPGAEATLRRLEITVLRRLDGLLQGDHLGLLPGPGSERGEAREYRPGDDVRRMDWSVTARTTVPHVSDLIADRELETTVLVDLSASLNFGTGTCEKRDLAIASVAAVGFLTSRTGNRLGALVLRDGQIRAIPHRTGREALLLLVRQLLTDPRSTSPGPRRRTAPLPALPSALTGQRAGTDLAAAVERMSRPPRRRGLAVVVSDFLSDTAWERPLRALAARHQVLAVEVLDPRELELPNVGLVLLEDPETGQTFEVQTANAKVRERYAAAAAQQRAEVAAALRRCGAQHLVLRTDRDWLRDVVTHVLGSRRQRQAGHSPGARSTLSTSGGAR